MTDFRPGDIIGSYEILDALGRGGMGIVYRAIHRTMKREVALKVPPRFHYEDSLRKRFQTEVEVTSALSHPNILRAYDAGVHQSVPWLVTELVQGSDLRERVHRDGVLSVEDALRYVLDAARGLEYVHARGIVHRDVKPANLIVDENDTVRVIDFGLAYHCDGLRDLDASTVTAPLPRWPAEYRMSDIPEDCASIVAPPFKSESSTHVKELLGTPAFMAPEQSSTPNVDQRADVYGLGCTLYYLLTRTHVFTQNKPPSHGTVLEVLESHRRDPIPSICDRRPDVSQNLDQILTTMLAKVPGDRFQSMCAVIQALEQEQTNLGLGSRIFISYRRDDSYDATHRLYENLIQHFGAPSVIMDVDTIPVGTDFREFITEAVSRSAGVLVIIGDHWLDARNAQGQRRLEDPGDYVLAEIETALTQGKPVIPVLVGRATMPAASAIPESIRELAFRNAAEVRSGRNYHRDVEKLTARLNEVMRPVPAAEPVRADNFNPPAVTSYQLRVTRGPHQGAAFPLDNTRILIGRSADADVSLPWDMTVSRSACSLDWNNESRQFVVHSFNARCGVILNGRPVVEPTLFQPGQTLQLGGTILVLVEVQ